MNVIRRRFLSLFDLIN